MRTPIALWFGALAVGACASVPSRSADYACPASTPAAVVPVTNAAAAQRFASPALPPPVFADPARKARLAAAFPEIDRLFAAQMREQHLVGLAVGVVIDGDLAWSKGFGVQDLGSQVPVDVDTVFGIGSITKSFTAIAMLELRDQGKLSLDDRVDAHLSEVAGVVYKTRDSSPITIRELLSHGSGLPGNVTELTPTAADLLRALDGLPLERAPHEQFSYSMIGYGLAGILVGRVAGVPYRDFVDAHVLRPLGMTATVWDEASVPAGHRATGYDRDGDGLKPAHEWRMGALEPAGKLLSSVRDFARYAAFHLAASPPRDEPDPGPLRRSSVREMQRPQERIGFDVFPRAAGRPQRANVDAYGLGLQTLESCEFDRIVWHGGAVPGFDAQLYLLPEHGVAIVAMTNTAETDLAQASRDSLRALLATGALAKRVLRPDAAHVAARDAIDGLLEHWDDAVAARTFGKKGLPGVFLSQPKDWESVRAAHGACHLEGDVEAPSAWQAVWLLACERGKVSFTATLGADDRTRITDIDIRQSLPPDERLLRAATKLATLVAHWDDRAADALLASWVDRAKLRANFRAAAADHGACRIDHLANDPDRTHARFALACAKGAMELRAALDDRSGTINDVLLVEPSDPEHKCPQ